MKVIKMLSDYVFEVQKNQDAMLIGEYYSYPGWIKHCGDITYWYNSGRVFIANDNRFEDL